MRRCFQSRLAGFKVHAYDLIEQTRQQARPVFASAITCHEKLRDVASGQRFELRMLTKSFRYGTEFVRVAVQDGFQIAFGKALGKVLRHLLAYAGYDLAAIDRRWQLLDEQTQHLRLAMLDLQQHQEALSSETRDLHQHQQNLFSETQAYKTLLLRSVDAIRKQAESIRNLTTLTANYGIASTQSPLKVSVIPACL